MADKYFVEYTRIEVKQFRETLLQHMTNVKKSVAERIREALDASLVFMESSGTKSGKQDTSSRSGNDTDTDDADIRPIYDKEPMTEVGLTTKTIEQTTSLITQNADLKAKIQEKAFAIAALKNELRKSKGNTKHYRIDNFFDTQNVDLKRSNSGNKAFALCFENELRKSKGNSVDTKFAKPSVLGKPIYNHPEINQLLDNRLRLNLNVLKFQNQEVNSCKIKSHKTRNSNKLVEQKSHTQQPGRQIFTGHRFSPNKSYAMYEKMSPRSDLRWKPTSNILNTVGLRWVPTGKIFTSCTSKADSESTHGSNVDISKIRECKQTLDLSAANMTKLESVFCPLFDEYFNGENQVVSMSSAVTTADASDKCQQQLDSTLSTSTLATTVTVNGNFDIVILFSIHSDEWKSFQSQPQTALRCFGNKNVIGITTPILALPERAENFIEYCDASHKGLVMTIGLDLSKQILEAQTKARKPENLEAEDVGGRGKRCPAHRSRNYSRSTTEKIIQIKRRFQAARDRQKSYAYVRRKPLEFQVGDKFMLKVSPWKGVIRFGKRGKLNPRNVYCEPLVILLDEIHIDDKPHFVKELVEIMDREVKRLKQSRIPIIKVRWNSRRGPEFTWEREDQFRKKYPHLFTKTAPSTSAAY
ncbi:hypothetical protein Tco_0432196 [Tanacetum coccineum]